MSELCTALPGLLASVRGTESWGRLAEAARFLLGLHADTDPIKAERLRAACEEAAEPSETRRQQLRDKSLTDGGGSVGGAAADLSTEDHLTRFQTRQVGLINLGNTCYMNCVLQALHHTPLFREQVVSHTCDLQRQRVLASLQQVFLFLRYSKRNIFSPSEFLRLARPPWFQAGRQQDCSEFLTHLLDTLQEEEQSCASHSEPSLVRKVFGLKLKTSIQCRNCRWQSENEDWVTDLHLSILDPESKVLSNLIENYFEPEHLTGDNEYSCRNCDTPTEADRTVTVVSAPECLIITMKRFKYNSEYNRRVKIMTDVFSPLYLELPVAVGEQRYHYHLYGVVIHSGNTCDGGHYYTWIR